MKSHVYLSTILRFFKTALLTDLSLFIMVGLVCWLLGWRTAHQYGHGLELAGLLAIFLVLLSIPGTFQERRLAYQTVGPLEIKELYQFMQQKTKESCYNLTFLLLAGVTGLIATGLGVTLQDFFID